MSIIRYCTYLVFVAFTFVGCGDSGCNVVPNTTFNITVSQASHPNVFVAGGSAYATGGACGLILYNHNGNLLAYDRCSPVNIDAKNRVDIDGFLAVDKATGAKWLLVDGSPSSIAECPLKPYRVSKNGLYYTVYN